ncbi:MAG: ribonuclease HIII [Solobacterium sp.]|nr:ribonuclease HIII [Solobacterium sp.]
MSTITLVLTPEDASRLYQTFIDDASPAPQYAEWQLRVENCVITRYRSGKTVFQGKDAEIYASPFQKQPAPVSEKAADNTVLPQAGSDEVGTGDYFGPVCVCACIVDEKSAPLVSSLGVTDSKAMTDEAIRKIAPQLLEKLPHSLLIVSPEKYNQVHDSMNLNAMKAVLHNQAYVHLQEKYGLPKTRVIDQFAPPASYWRYLSGQKHIVRPMHFETKAESRWPAVAAASVIARYAFLCAMDDMEKRFGMHFAKGAGAAADASGKEFLERYGEARLKEAAKLHFRNTAKIKGR